MALQRAIHDAGAFRVRTSIPVTWNQPKHMKIFDINTVKVSQKMAGYLANRVRTWEEAKEIYSLETEGLAIFACAARVNNAQDPYQM